MAESDTKTVIDDPTAEEIRQPEVPISPTLHLMRFHAEVGKMLAQVRKYSPEVMSNNITAAVGEVMRTAKAEEIVLPRDFSGAHRHDAMLMLSRLDMNVPAGELERFMELCAEAAAAQWLVQEFLRKSAVPPRQ